VQRLAQEARVHIDKVKHSINDRIKEQNSNSKNLREAIRKEFSKLKRIGMRLKVKRSTMPKERRVLNTNGFLKSSVMEFSGQASSVWVHPNSWS